MSLAPPAEGTMPARLGAAAVAFAQLSAASFAVILLVRVYERAAMRRAGAHAPVRGAA